METIEQKTIGEIVAQNYRAATVFKKYNIDFCCRGNRSLEEVCRTKNVSIWELTKKLDEAMNNDGETITDYQSWPLDLLADYIEKKHHRYVENRIREIKPFLEKLCKVHGSRHPELLEIYRLFSASAGELAMHMKREELVLFPFVRKMAEVRPGETTPVPAHFETVENPVRMMMHEHDTEGKRFREIAELSNNYTPPADACNTYRVTFALLQEFEDDLHLHIHLENNILFPRAIALEKELRG